MSRKKLVIFTANKTCGGAERFTILTAQGLQTSHDWEVSLICGGWHALDAWCEEFSALGGAVLRQNYNSLSSWLLRDLPAAYRLIRQADVVQVNITDQIGKINLLGVLLCWLARRPAVLSERLVITPEERGHAGWSIWLWRCIARLYHRLASGVVAISTADSQILSDYYKVKPSKIKLIPVGIDPTLFSPAHHANAAETQANFGISEEAQVIICTSRLLAEKGQAYLIEAAPSILKNHPKAHFVLVGDGEAKAALVGKVQQMNLADHFTFTGNIASQQVAKWLGAADLAVLPSLRESVSRAACEAIAAGVPLVATDVGSTRELIEDDKTGWIVPLADASALACAIQKALADPVVSRTMADQARQHLLQTHSLPQTIATTNAFYLTFCTA